MDDSFQTYLRRELNWFSYRFADWTATVCFGAILLGMGVAFTLLVGAWFMDVGNYYLGGSGSLDATGWVLGLMKSLDGRDVFLPLSMLASFVVAWTREKHPLARIVSSVGCIALHLMLLGALL